MFQQNSILSREYASSTSTKSPPIWPPPDATPSPALSPTKATALSWPHLTVHHPTLVSLHQLPAFDPAAAARRRIDAAARNSAARPPRTSWLLARVQEAGDLGTTAVELFQVAETHVPGLFRSRTQLRGQLELLRTQGKVRLPQGRYVCAVLYHLRKDERRVAFISGREERNASRTARSRKF